MITLKTAIEPDTWITLNWEDYLQFCDDSDYEKAKFYYYDGQGRIEMTPLGNDHASDHAIINYAIYLYAGLRNIPLNGKNCCSYRQTGSKEIQPDLSFYIGDNSNVIPYGTSIIDLDRYPVPNLVIEVANSSLEDDQGTKRLLYEDLGVNEYWIIDVKSVNIIAFKIKNGGSWRITQSQILPQLDIKLLVEALRQTRENNHSEVSRWLLEKFQT